MKTIFILASVVFAVGSCSQGGGNASGNTDPVNQSGNTDPGGSGDLPGTGGGPAQNTDGGNPAANPDGGIPSGSGGSNGSGDSGGSSNSTSDGGSVSPATGKTVLIYSGAPVCEGCDTQIGNIVAAPQTPALKALAPKVRYVKTWAGVSAALAALPAGSLFVIGGTDDDLSPWGPGGSQQMTATSITAVQNFVRGGGRYLGICGGAYVAPATFSDEITQFNALGLMPIDADNFPRDDAEEHVENVAWNDGKTYGLFFQSGSFFTTHPSSERFEIWGNYLAATRPIAHPAAIAAIEYTYGNGKVFATGFHSEATRDFWESTSNIPPGWVPHTEILEAIVAELLSNRVLQ